MSKSQGTRIELPVLQDDPAPESPPVEGRVRVGLVTLGCDKNTVDSERISARLATAGAEVSADTDDADVIVVNTCGFIDAAKEQSIDTILEASRLKAEGRIQAVVAMGCLVQRYQDELEEELDEVDLFLSLTETNRLLPELRERGLLPKPGDFVPNMERPLRVLTTETTHTSYLKISEGCDHSCAFCAIPLMRGKYRSTPIDHLVEEARQLESQGVRELNVVSQDTTWYGRDWLRGRTPVEGEEFFIGTPFQGMAGDPEPKGGASANARRGPADHARRRGYLPDLLRAVIDETEIPWIRLFYMYPSGIYPELLDVIAAEDRIVPYLDVPIQHGADPVLKRMRRPERQKTIREQVRSLRDAVPDLTLRTTVIVGFPGEREEDFESMLEFIEEMEFDRLGAFPYSVEEGTRAASMADQVPEAVRRERLERLLDMQRTISFEKNQAWVGREVDVLVDREAEPGEDGDRVGRTAAQALDIDGVVHIRNAGDVTPGRFVRARIIDASEYDLIAEPMSAGRTS